MAQGYSEEIHQVIPVTCALCVLPVAFAVLTEVVAEPLPSVLQSLTAVTVEEYGKQNAPEKRPLSIRFENESMASTVRYEALQVEDGTEVLARWQGRHLTGQAAITLRRLGRGHVVYVGSYLTKELVDSLLPQLVKLSGARPLLPSAASGSAASGVEIVRRDGDGKRLWFFINHVKETSPSTTCRQAQTSSPMRSLKNH